MKRDNKERLGSLGSGEILDLIRGALLPAYSGFSAFLTLLAFWVIFTRPQANLSFLAAIRLPMIITGLTIFFTMSRFSLGWCKQSTIILAFLGVEAFRIFVGRLIFDDLVRNDRYAFWSWMDIAYHFFVLNLPLGAYLKNDRSLIRFCKIWCWMLIYLGLYALTHKGFGPKGFLGDENDMAYQLDMFLPLPVILFLSGTRSISRMFLLVTILLGSGGVVASFSRGGFLGFVVVMGVLLMRSKKKGLFIGLGLFFLVTAIPFLPEGYIQEMRSVVNTNQGTAATRRHFWSVAMRIFYDPHWTLIGVGMGNTTFHLSDYETAEDTANYPSIAGRAVHSMYVQLFADLGLWGLAILGSLIAGSVRSNRRNQQISAEILSRLRRFEQIAYQTIEGDKDRRNLFARTKTTLEYFAYFSSALNVGFIGMMVAGAFLSTLYYPQVWFFVGLSGSIGVHARKFLPLAETFAERLEKEAFTQAPNQAS